MDPFVHETEQRRGGRVVEGARLESVYAGNRIAGSNPAPSAIYAVSTPSREALSNGRRHYDQRFQVVEGARHVVNLPAGSECRSLGRMWRDHRPRAPNMVFADSSVCSLDRGASFRLLPIVISQALVSGIRRSATRGSDDRRRHSARYFYCSAAIRAQLCDVS